MIEKKFLFLLNLSTLTFNNFINDGYFKKNSSWNFLFYFIFDLFSRFIFIKNFNQNNLTENFRVLSHKKWKNKRCKYQNEKLYLTCCALNNHTFWTTKYKHSKIIQPRSDLNVNQVIAPAFLRTHELKKKKIIFRTRKTQ